MARKFSGTCALGLFGLVAACSDPVAPSAQGAASLYLTTFSGTGAFVCNAKPHWANIPDAPSGQQHFTYSKGDVAVDGQNQASIQCSVKDTGGPFAVTATLQSPATDPQTRLPVNPTIVKLSATIQPDTTSQGSLIIQDNNTTTEYTSVDDSGMSAGTCAFNVHPATMNDQLAIAPGRMWASVTCPRFRDVGSSDSNNVCSIASGIVILENCAQ
jgi:hypothetical protein